MKKLYTLLSAVALAATVSAAPALKNVPVGERINTISLTKANAHMAALKAVEAPARFKAPAAEAPATTIDNNYITSFYGYQPGDQKPSSFRAGTFMTVTIGENNKATLEDFGGFTGYTIQGVYDPATNIITVPSGQVGVVKILDENNQETEYDMVCYNVDFRGEEAQVAPSFDLAFDPEARTLNYVPYFITQDGKNMYASCVVFDNNAETEDAYEEYCSVYEIMNDVVNAQVATGVTIGEESFRTGGYAYAEKNADESVITVYNLLPIFQGNVFDCPVKLNVDKEAMTATAVNQAVANPRAGDYEFLLFSADAELTVVFDIVETTDSEGNKFTVLVCPECCTFCTADVENIASLTNLQVLLPFNLDLSGVSNVTVADDNAPVEYFNLQGVRVANPENGLFIRRQGSTTTKVLVK